MPATEDMPDEPPAKFLQNDVDALEEIIEHPHLSLVLPYLERIDAHDRMLDAHGSEETSRVLRKVEEGRQLP
ncbi:hypothetical protein B0H14DRAFT_3450883 [Mycena olivaceomarginata]|nr:hypothetical protein B0H14DRAFT_3450883 [Mycena olivaceomarginata]